MMCRKMSTASAHRYAFSRKQPVLCEFMPLNASRSHHDGNPQVTAISSTTTSCKLQQYRFKSTGKSVAMNYYNPIETTEKHTGTRFRSHSASFQNDPEDEEDDFDLYHLHSSTNEGIEVDYDYSVTIGNAGQTISISALPKNLGGNNDTALSGESWEFSSSLLWVNDAKYVHSSSGQRLRKLGQYSGEFAIVLARLVCVGKDDSFVGSVDDNSSSSSIQLHPIPPRGSMHSRGGIYHLFSDNDRAKERTLVKLEWNYGGESIFDLEWLIDQARNNYLGRDILSNSKIDKDTIEAYPSIRRPKERARMTTAVTKDIAIGAMDNPKSISISTFDYEEISKNEDVLYEGMRDIFEHGAILVRNAPDVALVETEGEVEFPKASESIVGNLGKRFSGGALSHGSLYGDIFHVKSKNDAENIAYTNMGLPPHQDLTYYESKPLLQLLHCATSPSDNNNYILGGESVLIDSMAAAKELSRLAPDLFDVLLKTEATFLKERHDADIVSPKPHIVVDPTYGQVVEVNWSPPFEGPLQIHPRIAVEDYVRAYQAFETILDSNCDGVNSNPTLLPQSLETLLRDYSKKYTWEYELQKGDVLVFNNQRMLHGRRSFRSFGTVQRHLIGCYTDAMDTASRYRQLLRNRECKSGGSFGRNLGNGCRWM